MSTTQQHNSLLLATQNKNSIKEKIKLPSNKVPYFFIAVTNRELNQLT